MAPQTDSKKPSTIIQIQKTGNFMDRLMSEEDFIKTLPPKRREYFLAVIGESVPAKNQGAKVG